VAQQRLGDAVARRRARAAQVVAAAHEVAQPLVLGRGRLDEGELAGAVEAHELLGVAAVGLHPITCSDRHKRRRDHVAGDADPRQQSQEVIAAGPGLVGDGQAIGPAEAVDEATHGALGVLEAGDLGRSARRRQHTGHERVLVRVEGDPGANLGRGGRANVRHGLVLLRMRHWPLRWSSTAATLTRDRCERRGPARFGVHADYFPRINGVSAEGLWGGIRG